VDDKETKNIDGIKVPDTAQSDSGENIAVNITTNNASDTQDNDMSIDSNGDIAEQEPTVPQPEQAPAPVAEEPTTVASDDPGIVPSVQPTIATSTTSPATEVARLKERNKHLKIWLVVLMLLLVAVASALVVYFAQQSKAKNDLKTQQQQNAALQQELTDQQQTATQKTIDELNSQLEAEKAKNAELQTTIDEQKKEIQAYQDAVKKLLTACGSACASVDVPEEDTTNTTN
jgi:type II secretory pathway pseudopilin PulG